VRCSDAAEPIEGRTSSWPRLKEAGGTLMVSVMTASWNIAPRLLSGMEMDALLRALGMGM